MPPIQKLAQSVRDPVGLDNYLRSHWRYISDPEWTEYVMGPQYQMDQASENGYYYGDCDDSSTLAATVCLAMGLPTWCVVYRLTGSSEFSHVNVRTRSPVDGSVVDIDPTVDAGALPITRNVEETLEVVV